MAVYQLVLLEPADDRLEGLLLAFELPETCPVHVGTTLDGGDCAMCRLEEQAMRRPYPSHRATPLLDRLAAVREARLSQHR